MACRKKSDRDLGIGNRYGQNEGSFNLFEALATLAFEGRARNMAGVSSSRR